MSVHRGRVSEHSLRTDFLDWFGRQGKQVFDELSLISGAIIDRRVQVDD